MCKCYIFNRYCACSSEACTIAYCGVSHCKPENCQVKLDTENMSVPELMWRHPEDKVILPNFACSRCITRILPEHFLHESYFANALHVAGPFIDRAKNIPMFLDMERRVRKYPSKFR